MFVFIDVTFVLLTAGLLAVSMGRRIGFIATVYIASCFIFVLVSHVVWRLSAFVSYDGGIYLIAHVINLTFLVAMAVMARQPSMDRPLFQGISGLHPYALVVPILIYFAFNAYHLVKYGRMATLNLSEGSGSTSFTRDSLDEAISQLITPIASGAALGIVIRLAVDARAIANRGLSFAFGAYMLFNLAVGASGAGGRRTLLILAIAFMLAKIGSAPGGIAVIMRRNARTIVTSALLCLLLAGYYQQIRNNADLRDVQVRLAAEDLWTRLDGLRMLLTPGKAAELRGGETPEFINRSGPFDLLVALVDGRLRLGRSTDGEITAYSFEMVMPRVFYPDKPQYDTDDIIANHFNVTPANLFWASGQFFQTVDYSTSVLAVLFADFGWIGIFLAAGVTALAMRLVTRIFVLMPRNPIIALGALGAMFDLVSLMEGTLVTLLSLIRALTIFIVLGSVVELLWFRPRVPIR
jgi:hypothetical protein